MVNSADFTPETSKFEGEQEKKEEGPETGYDTAIKSLSSGQIISGLVVHLDEHGALVDVGTKSEGLIPQHELGEPVTGEGRPLAVGERVDVYVLKPEDEEGAAVLSKKMADYEALWDRLIQAFEKGEIIGGMVMERVKGGLVVDLGVRAFLPASHVNVRNVQGLEALVGRGIKLKILEVDRERKRVVVSQKEALSELREKKRDATLSTLQEGQVKKGVVRRLTDYGAFVDIGGVDGLLHVTEMSWSYLTHPSEVVKVGDRIEVMVLKIDKERERISLGLKQILPDPWEDIGRKYHVGDLIKGHITRSVQAGAFFRLPEGVEGIIPASELREERRSRGEDAPLPTGEVEAKIVAIRASERRLTLSLRLAHQDKERKEVRQYLAKQADDSRVTLGDIFGEAFQNAELKSSSELRVESLPSEAEGAKEGSELEEAGSANPQLTTDNAPVATDAERECEPSASPAASEPENPPSPNSSDDAAP